MNICKPSVLKDNTELLTRRVLLYVNAIVVVISIRLTIKFLIQKFIDHSVLRAISGIVVYYLGIPATVLTDNGPQSSRNEHKRFIILLF